MGHAVSALRVRRWGAPPQRPLLLLLLDLVAPAKRGPLVPLLLRGAGLPHDCHQGQDHQRRNRKRTVGMLHPLLLAVQGVLRSCLLVSAAPLLLPLLLLLPPPPPAPPSQARWDRRPLRQRL